MKVTAIFSAVNFVLLCIITVFAGIYMDNGMIFAIALTLANAAAFVGNCAGYPNKYPKDVNVGLLLCIFAFLLLVNYISKP